MIGAGVSSLLQLVSQRRKTRILVSVRVLEGIMATRRRTSLCLSDASAA